MRYWIRCTLVGFRDMNTLISYSITCRSVMHETATVVVRVVCGLCGFVACLARRLNYVA